MPIPVECSRCHGRFNAPDRAVGHTVLCPRCNNRFRLQPPAEFESTGTIEMSQADVTEADRSRSSRTNSIVILTCVVVSLTTVAIVGYLTLYPEKAIAVADAEADASHAAVATDEIDPIETNSSGLGYSLDDFKSYFVIGENWREMADVTRDDGTISYQLLSNDLRLVMAMANGSPDDLGNVSINFSVMEGQSDEECATRIMLMANVLARFSEWTVEEIVQWWLRCIQMGDNGVEDRFTIQKHGQELAMVPIGCKGGTVFINEVSADINSTAPRLEEWIVRHPLPPPKSGKTHYHSCDTAGKIANAKFSFKSFSNQTGNGDFIGELSNESGRSYQTNVFKLSIYNPDGRLVDTGTFIISHFKAGEVRSFEVSVEEVPFFFSYKIDMEHGS